MCPTPQALIIPVQIARNIEFETTIEQLLDTLTPPWKSPPDDQLIGLDTRYICKDWEDRKINRIIYIDHPIHALTHWGYIAFERRDYTIARLLGEENKDFIPLNPKANVSLLRK